MLVCDMSHWRAVFFLVWSRLMRALWQVLCSEVRDQETVAFLWP